MLEYWPKAEEKYENQQLKEKWDRIIKIKEEVSKVLEEARAQKLIGNSLEAEVIIKSDKSRYEFLEQNKKILEEVFIISGLKINRGEKFEINVERAEGQKCERCWMYSNTVGQDKENPTICKKCSDALK